MIGYIILITIILLLISIVVMIKKKYYYTLQQDERDNIYYHEHCNIPNCNICNISPDKGCALCNDGYKRMNDNVCKSV
jgi:hypothetical protein